MKLLVFQVALGVGWMLAPIMLAVACKVLRWQTVLKVLAYVSLVTGWVAIAAKLFLLK